MKKIPKHINPKILTALSLMLISNLGWLIPLTIVPWLEINIQHKALIGGACLVFGQVTYNIGLFMLGADLLKKLRRKKIRLQAINQQFSILVRLIKKRVKRLEEFYLQR